MSMNKKIRFDFEHNPPPCGTTGGILTACRIAQRFRHRVPTVKELRAEFDMSRAAAYRWHSAMKLAMRPERTA